MDGDAKILESLNLKTGDIVKYVNDAEGKVCAAAKVFDGTTHDLTPPSPYYPDDYGNSFQVRANSAYKLDGTNLYLSDSRIQNERLSRMEAVPLSTAAVYRVTSGKKIEKITLNEVKTFKDYGRAEYAFAMLCYGVGRILVVYEN